MNKLKLKDSESKQTNKQENYFIWERQKKKITPKRSGKKAQNKMALSAIRKWRGKKGKGIKNAIAGTQGKWMI